MKIIFAVLLTVETLCAVANGRVFLEKSEASQYLKREKRAKRNVFEEKRQDNEEYECFKEVCDYEEVREVFEDDKRADAYWSLLTDQCNTALNRCNETGTFRCENKYGTHICVCKLGYVGNSCETEIYINVCEKYDNLCVNGGTCVDDEKDTYYCACPSGWYGSDCAQGSGGSSDESTTAEVIFDTTEATTEPIVISQATTEPIVISQATTKPNGTTLETTTQMEETNECRLGFCPSGSQCIDGVNSFQCVCPPSGCQAPSEDEENL